MKKNMGSADKIIRVLIAIIIGVLIFTSQITGVLAIILGIFAVIFLVTSLFGFCLLYLPFNLSTLKKSK
jgi:Inner membrane protein YgaP-like, transmembrane domain